MRFAEKAVDRLTILQSHLAYSKWCWNLINERSETRCWERPDFARDARATKAAAAHKSRSGGLRVGQHEEPIVGGRRGFTTKHGAERRQLRGQREPREMCRHDKNLDTIIRSEE